MTTPNNGKRRPASHSAGALLPLLLIVGGLLLLASNQGWIDWRALGEFLRLWPLALVAVGADLLTNGRYRLPIVAGTLVLALLLFALIGTGASPASGRLGGRAIDHPLSGATAASVTLRSGVSRLELRGGAEPGQLLNGTITTRRGERIEESVRGAKARPEITISSAGGAQPLLFGFNESSAWELRLTDEIPVMLSVEAGVGRAALELSDVLLEGLSLRTGVGATTVTLPRRGAYEASIEAGVGETTVRLPPGLGARISVSRGLGSVSVPRGFARTDDTYTSPGFEDAEARVELRISAGVGSLIIEEGGAAF